MRSNPALDGKIRRTTDTLSRNTLVIVNGVKYSPSDSESIRILSFGFEKNVWRYLKPKERDVFIDIGAHVGKYTLQVARIVGNEGLTIALEPHPDNYKALLKGIQLNGFKNIVALNIAAWDKDCKLKLFIGDTAGHHSAKINKGLGHIEVEAKTVDSIVKSINVGRVDWIKIDVEGAALEVIRGLHKTITKYAPKIILEVLSENSRAVLKLMQDYGYAIAPFYDSERYFYGVPRQKKKGKIAFQLKDG